MIGKRISHYDIGDKIGAGGFFPESPEHLYGP